MAYVREQVCGTSGQDMAKINENFMNIWSKVFGDVDFADANKKLQDTILTQYIPFTDNGSNLDTDHPCYIRFYVPPTVKKVKDARLSCIIDKYRMDSTTTMGGGKVENLDINISMSEGGGGTFQTNSTSATCSVTTGTSSTSCGATSYVDAWGDSSFNMPAPNAPMSASAQYNNHWYVGDGENLSIGFPIKVTMVNGNPIQVADAYFLQHRHTFNATVNIPPLSGTCIVPGQTGSVVLAPHTHKAVCKLSLPDHEHKMKPGIYVADTLGNTQFLINDNAVCTLTASNSTKNDIDITKYIKIGQWNTIKCTVSGLSRVTIFGYVQAIMKSV